MSLIDHAYFIVLAVVYPVMGYLGFRRLMRRIEAGQHVDRSGIYNMTMASHWAMFVILFVLWSVTGRSLAALGFALDVTPGFLAGVVLTIAGIVFFIVQLRNVRSAGDDELNRVRRQLGRLEFIIPRNGNELGRFYALSLTAGIVEETLWRGFVIWYLTQWAPLWAAAVLSAIGFGIAHAYQGVANLPRVTLVGAVFAVLFVVTGSIWLPMVLHAAVDILQGRTTYEIVRRTDSGRPPTNAAPAQA